MKKEILFLIPNEFGNTYRKNPEACIQVEATLGRKYYTTENGRKFYIETDVDKNGVTYHQECNDFTSDYYAYETELDAQKELGRRNLLKKLIKSFNLTNLSFCQLEAIQKILDMKDE